MARANRTEARTKRIEARIAPAALGMVRRAADLKVSSVSDFVVDAAQEKALRHLSDDRVVRLRAEEQKRFVALLFNPPKPNAAMKRAARAHATLFGR